MGTVPRGREEQGIVFLKTVSLHTFCGSCLQYGLEYGPVDVKFQIVLKMFPDSDDV